MDAKQHLQQLRTLQKQLADANAAYDRFGRADQLKQIELIEAQIQTIPQAIRDQAYCDEIRVDLPYFVESYLLKRAARFIEGMDDLKSALVAMVTTPDPLITSDPRLARIAKGLPALQLAGTLEEDLEIAIELAQSFEESRRGIGAHRVAFERSVRDYLDERSAHGAPDEPEDLRAAFRQWQDQLDDFRTNFATYSRITSDPVSRVQAARVRLLGQVAILRLLGSALDNLENRIADLQGNWNAQHSV